MENLSDIAPIKIAVLSPFYDDDHKIPLVDKLYRGFRFNKYAMRVSGPDAECPDSNYQYIYELPDWVFSYDPNSLYLLDELKIRGIKFKDNYNHDVDVSMTYACSLYMMQLHDSRYYQFRINFPGDSYRTEWRRMNNLK